MSFSHETRERIDQFAKEQSIRFLDAAEMTYLEKLRRKTGLAKQKARRKLARFKSGSDQAREAQDDMVLYMSDYMEDLMAKGLSEQEALAKAKEELVASGDAGLHTGLEERLRQYYENRDPAEEEAVGLLYGGFLLIGMVVGALVGYVLSGGRAELLRGGWVDTAIGAIGGALMGIGLGVIGHAISIRVKRK